MTIKELKILIADMADDAAVFARDRDCIALRSVDIVNHPVIVETTIIRNVSFHTNINDIPGGEHVKDHELGESKQAIIFCDCD